MVFESITWEVKEASLKRPLYFIILIYEMYLK